MLDITKLLQYSIRLDREIAEDREIVMSAKKSLENVFVSLDVELAEIANTSEWFKVWKTHRGKSDPDKTPRETLLTEYVDALDFFLLLCAKLKWTHLIVLDREGIEKLKNGRPTELNKEYLAIKHMLYNSYFENRQEDFRHAWRLFLKLAFVEFGFSESDIMSAYFEKYQINEDRQANDY